MVQDNMRGAAQVGRSPAGNVFPYFSGPILLLPPLAAAAYYLPQL